MYLLAQEISFQKIAEVHPDQLMGTLITDIDVTESGFIAVALNDIAKVQVYNNEAQLVNEYGKRGRGPGDFSNLMSVVLADSIVYAMESGPSGRIHAFSKQDPDRYQTYLIPRSPKGRAVRSWSIDSGVFLVEFRPAISNRNIDDEITSAFGLVSIFENGEIVPLLEHRSNELFIDESNGGFSVSGMPYGRKNFMIPAGDNLFHNWSGDVEFTRIDLRSFDKTTVKPDIGSGSLPITEEGYRKYFLEELGISKDDNIDDVVKSLSSDRSARLTLLTVQSKLDNRDKLHDYYPSYRWITGDKEKICFGTYTYDIMINKVSCIVDDGTLLGEGEISSDIQILSQSSEYMAGLRQLDNGLQSVVLFKIDIID